MKFKIGNCIQLSTITAAQLRTLLEHLASLDYLVSNVEYILEMKNSWVYIGADSWGDVQLYDHAYSYLDINAWQIEHPTNIVNFTDLGI